MSEHQAPARTAPTAGRAAQQPAAPTSAQRTPTADTAAAATPVQVRTGRAVRARHVARVADTIAEMSLTSPGLLTGPDRAVQPLPARARGWSEASRAQLVDYVAQLLPLLGLSDWEIEVDWRTPTEHEAQIEVLFSQRRALLRLHRDFPRRSREHNRDTVVHELIHCHLEPVTHYVDRANEQLCQDKSMTQSAARMMRLGFVQQMEAATDALAGALARTLPLPPVWA